MTQGCNSFFGQDNCIEVIPYLPEAIEYQYDNEPKQIIYSTGGELSYELKEIYPDGTKFYVFGTYISKRLRYCNQQQLFRSVGSVKSPFFVSQSPNQYNELFVQGSDGVQRALRRITQFLYDSKYLGFVAGTSIIYRDPGNDCPNVNRSYGHSPVEIFSVPQDNNIQAQCQFIVTETFTDGTTEVRHEETRENCPDVVKIPASLDYDKAQKFDIKTSALGYIEAVNFTYGVNEFGVQTTTDIPPECINIYNVIPYIPIGLTANSSNVGVIREPITQVCSVRSSPPPEVIFNCGQSCNPCESCPDGTCAIICDDHVCCYDESGIAVKEIAIEDYCDG